MQPSSTNVNTGSVASICEITLAFLNNMACSEEKNAVFDS